LAEASSREVVAQFEREMTQDVLSQLRAAAVVGVVGVALGRLEVLGPTERVYLRF